MPSRQTIPSKPHSEVFRPGITYLPPMTRWRRFIRKLWHWVCRFIAWLFIHPGIHGLENFPSQGPALIVTNHVGDADIILALAFLPHQPDALGKAELYDYPILGKAMRAYGMIWVHRGRADRRAIRAALDGLQEKRFVAVAPEGRESLSGGLETGTNGAAYLALKSGVPILPISFTGTENDVFYSNLKRLRRTPMTLTIGPLFHLDPHINRQEAIRCGTEKIMHTLAQQLPTEYQGIYRFE
jgi:1-acyl-sn-glycerol-3-phosphate acyltransferase